MYTFKSMYSSLINTEIKSGNVLSVADSYQGWEIQGSIPRQILKSMLKTVLMGRPESMLDEFLRY